MLPLTLTYSWASRGPMVAGTPGTAAACYGLRASSPGAGRQREGLISGHIVQGEALALLESALPKTQHPNKPRLSDTGDSCPGCFISRHRPRNLPRLGREGTESPPSRRLKGVHSIANENQCCEHE